MSDTPRRPCSRALPFISSAATRTFVRLRERDVVDLPVPDPSKRRRDDGLAFSRPSYVGALAFGLFVGSCASATSTWAQTPGDISSPLRINREEEIDATRFSSGIYGDPAPNNPSPFIENSTTAPLPPFFSGDAPDAVPNEARNQLEALAWAVGCWELESAGFVFQTKIDWAPGGSYLLCRDFVRPVVAPSAPSSPIRQNDVASSKFAALRVIGWNPVAGLFQTTIFCRDGSYGTGLWQREGESWRVATRILLVDGRAATSVEYFSPRPNGGFDWESTSRTVENAPLPNVGPAAARPLDPQIFERLEKSMFSDVSESSTPTTKSEFE
ncbi:MAG: hypothetical protein IJE77_03315 [Thermoguttaceae bacterium]|nr:hypothetical protein [Thermoguttaceae bacterium]MBQ9799076.1 hypothetical protein [Thermoguttaceae bacterium]